MKRVLGWIVILAILVAALGGLALYLSQPLRLPAVLRAHEKEITSLAFSADTELLASASTDGVVKIWDVRTGRLLRALTGHSGLPAVAFSADGKSLATFSDGGVKLWTTREWRTVWTTNVSCDRGQLAFHPNGNELLVAGFGAVYRVSVDTGRIVASLPGHVWSLALSADGDTVATGMMRLRLMDRATGAAKKPLAYPGRVIALAFSPDGKWLCGAGEPHVKLWTTNDWVERHSVNPHTWETNAVAFSADSRWLATAAYDHSSEAVKIWEVDTGKHVRTLAVEEERIGTAAASSQDGRLLAVGTSGGKIHLWEWDKITQGN